MDLTVDEIQTPTELEVQGKLRVRLSIPHKSNWQDGGRRSQRRHMYLMALKDALLDLGIYAKVEASVLPSLQHLVPIAVEKMMPKNLRK